MKKQPTSANVLDVLLKIRAVFCLIGILLSPIACQDSQKVGKLKTWNNVSKKEWPKTLIELVEKAEQEQIRYGSIDVLFKEWDGYYFCKVNTSPELLNLMKSYWNLSSVDKNHERVQSVLKQFRTQNVLPSIENDDFIECFVSSSFLEGEKGNWYCVINDQSKKQMIVWYFYNF